MNLNMKRKNYCEVEIPPGYHVVDLPVFKQKNKVIIINLKENERREETTDN